jgi:hypothetical protein
MRDAAFLRNFRSRIGSFRLNMMKKDFIADDFLELHSLFNSSLEFIPQTLIAEASTISQKINLQ